MEEGGILGRRRKEGAHVKCCSLCRIERDPAPYKPPVGNHGYDNIEKIMRVYMCILWTCVAGGLMVCL